MAEPPEESRISPTEEDFARRYFLNEQTRMTLEAGWLGKVFGSATNAPTNIAGLFVGILMLTIIIIGVVFVPSHI